MEDLSLKLYVVLSKAMRNVNKRVESEIKKLGLNPTEFGVMEVLYHKGPMPVQKVAQKILISSSRIAYTVNALEKKDYLQREKCQKDGRVVYLSLSDQGQALMDEVFAIHQKDLHQIFSVLDESEKKEMIRLAKKLGLSLVSF